MEQNLSREKQKTEVISNNNENTSSQEVNNPSSQDSNLTISDK